MAVKLPGPNSSSTPPASERLDSWKEIAAYLKRDIRTLQRWEKTEALPVHRHMHGRQGSIYAHKAEIDAWWNNGRARLEKEEYKELTLTSRRRRYLPWVVAAAAVLVVAFLWARSRVINPASSEMPEIRQLTYSGHDSWPAASPDGRLVAFVSDRDGRQRIWLKDLARGGEVAFTAGPDVLPRFSPDGSTILFTRLAGDVPVLCSVAIVGGEPRKLVEGQQRGYIDGDWSPDGHQITFARSEAGRHDSAIWLVGADGSGPHEIARVEGAFLYCPRWSPDGRTIAAKQWSPESGGYSIFLVTADGKEKRWVTAGGRQFFSLAWSSAGDEVVYFEQESASSKPSVSPPGAARLIRRNIASGTASAIFRISGVGFGFDIAGPGGVVFETSSSRQNLREISLQGKAASPQNRWLTRGTSQDRQPVYSPDGEWVLFTSNRSGNLDLWEISTKTGALRQITDHPADDWDPAFTTDGKKIIWSSKRTGHFEIWMADADGSGARQVTHDGASAQNPTATPDGSIVYASGSPSTRGIRKIHQDGSGDTRVVAGYLVQPGVSPDGRYVAYWSNMEQRPHVA
ncbi:MAG: PD40 domain-containing protein [Acidobacteria bacterium]|nr:PD40 domain-containing protein [Acidobacteriota bacterium]